MRRFVICLWCFTAVALTGLSGVGVFAEKGSPEGARTVRRSSAQAASQNVRIEDRIVCDYPGLTPRRRGREFNFASVREAGEVVERVLKATGVSRSVIGIKETDDENVNAKAGVYDGRLFIIYNPAFIEQVVREARTDLAADFVITHEVGHLQSGHPFEDDGSNPQEERQIRHRQELEADKYAGYNLRKRGAPLDESLAAINVSADERGTDTHPPKRDRVVAVRAGWQEADREIRDLVAAAGPRAPSPSASRTAPPTAPQANARPASGAFPLSVHNTSRLLAQDWWSWTVYVDAPPAVLDQIGCVEYQLHPTFTPPAIRVCERGVGRPFAMRAEGWGTFTIQVHVLMKDNRRYDLNHKLRLQ